MTNRVIVLGLLVTAVFACSSSGGAGNATGSGGTVPDAGAAEAAAVPVDDGTGTSPPAACPTSKFKTLVVVGDSISDVGGRGGATGQQPFYRTLLVSNDDDRYPSWKGFDLATCWGLDPTTNVVKVSKGGAVATVPAGNTAGNAQILLNQVTSLPRSLPGPVLVVGTIGGNDVQGGLVTVLTGTAAALQAKIDGFVSGFGQAMAELTKADRFGAGVKATVLMTDIYDPSGGTGHFYYAPGKATCPQPLGLWPDGTATAPLVAKWNDPMVTEAAKYPGLHIVPLRAPFEAHAVSTAAESNWFFQDCIHPSTLGHHALRGLFWASMVALP